MYHLITTKFILLQICRSAQNPIRLKSGLRCYTCDTDASGPICIDKPSDLTQSECTEGKDNCYTYRRDEPDKGWSRVALDGGQFIKN